MGGTGSGADSAVNTGNGGDGGYAIQYAGRGGSGIVIVRYPDILNIPSQVKAYWKMDEASGDLIDYLGFHNLTQVGTVASTTGKIGNARSTFSDSNYFRKSSHADFNTPLWAMSGWFYNTGPYYDFMFGIGPSSSQTPYRGLVMLGNTTLQGMGNGVLSCESLGAVSLNTWHHFFIGTRATSGAGETRLYIDGVVQTSFSGMSTLSGSSDFTIGTAVRSSNYGWRGHLDDMAYWDLTGTPYTWVQLEDYIKRLYAGGVGKGFSLI